LLPLGQRCFGLFQPFFENASKKVGALAVNFWKVVIAFFFLAIAGTIVRGVPFPYDASLRTWIFLSLSGIVGFVIADFFLFNAYVLIGSRITVIFQSLTPVFTALFAYIFIAERMQLHRLIGMAVTVVGILIVVLTRSHQTRKKQRGCAFGKRARLCLFLCAVPGGEHGAHKSRTWRL